MKRTSDQADRNKVWELIKDFRTALLVTVDAGGELDARPMGCLQKEFDGTLWFLTFAGSEKLEQIERDRQVLVAYMNPGEHNYLTISGRAEQVEDAQKLNELWTEGLRVWFPDGPDPAKVKLLAVTVEKAKYWTNPASALTYAWAYVKAGVTGQHASPDDIADTKEVQFQPSRRSAGR